jgi:type IV pilus assembly protein PilF
MGIDGKASADRRRRAMRWLRGGLEGGVGVKGRVALVAAVLLAALAAGCASSQQATQRKDSEAASGNDTGRALERAKIHTQLGVGYLEAGRAAIALQELNIAIEADRTYAPAYNARALVYMDLKEDAKAESDFKQALKTDPDYSAAKNNYGLFLCQRGRGQEGIRYLMDALRNPLYETPDLAYKNAGLCARKMGRDQEAEQYFARALKINPDQPAALYAMAEVHYAHGDLQASRELMNRYMKVVPNPGAEELWLAARLERRLGDRTAMMNYGNQLRRRFPGAPETKAFLEGRFE